MKEPSGYDVIVVGAGSTGSVLAARLSEDPDRSVLLVDEGPDPFEDGLPERVRDAQTVPSPGSDGRWTRWMEAELPTGRTIAACRGRLVGGSSAVNGAYFVRGTPADFDRWAAAGATEWSYEQVLPAFRRVERDLDHGDAAVHGADGPVPVRRAAPDELTPVTQAFLAAAVAAGIPAERDKNSGGPPGAGLVPRNEVDGGRVNAAMAYLDPCRERPNLVVHAGVRVRRVVIEHGRAIGVEVDAGRTSRVLRSDQVVVGAGAVASAQLLMLSGVGPAEHLLAQGVQVVVDAPGVGRLWDHPGIDLMWRPTAAAGPVQSAPLFQAAVHLDSGVGSDGADGDLELLAFTRPYGVANGDAPEDRALSLRVGVQRPSRPGQVLLDGITPHVPPVIQHAHLADPDDLARARAGVRAAVELLESAELAPLVGARSGPTSEQVASDELLDDWLRANVGTAMHSAGTCAMGDEDDPLAVVDQRGRVRGVAGLRIADTSIMPTPTSRGPAATAIMIGERIADHFDA